jgi:hypothetical protein
MRLYSNIIPNSHQEAVNNNYICPTQVNILMPFEFLKNWIFKQELKKTITIPSNNNSLVGVFINATIQDEINKVMDVLVRKGIKKENIRFLAFDNKLESINPITKSYNQKDIKWAGYPQSVEIDEFLKANYQKFYYLASSYEPHQEFILSKIQAKFKAGVHHKGIEKKLDFIVDAPFQNIVESLKVINQTLEKITKL